VLIFDFVIEFSADFSFLFDSLGSDRWPAVNFGARALIDARSSTPPWRQSEAAIHHAGDAPGLAGPASHRNTISIVLRNCTRQHNAI
jgi:hypothetical protein